MSVLAMLWSSSATVAQPCEPGWGEGLFGYPGVDGDVRAAVYFDDGRGPSLYVVGDFSVAGATAAANIARWDGASWQALGAGLTSTEQPEGLALAVFDDGRGPALYVGGWFTHADGVPAANIARWDGATWEPLGAGVDGGYYDGVEALAVFDDGRGPALYASGTFDTAGGSAASKIARWDGVAWSPLGLGLNAGAEAMVTFDDGSGAALYAGGGFDMAGGAPARSIARWNGSGWAALASDFSLGGGGVLALEVFDDGRGPAMYAAGTFEDALGVGANHVARWDGMAWEALGAGLNDFARTLCVFDDGSGPSLYVGGGFGSAGGVSADEVARWDGAQWAAVGEGLGGAGFGVSRLLGTHDGSGLLALGDFKRTGEQLAFSIARWDGLAWSALQRGVVENVYALANATLDGQRSVYAGGGQGLLDRWDGAAWTPLEQPVGDTVFALLEHDDGSGPALFAGGRFETAGGVAANRIAKWDGTQWHALGAGLGSTDATPVYELAVFDDGRGPALYAGGDFGVPVVGGQNVARWDGASWEAVASQMERSGSGAPRAVVHAMAVFDDGSGPALYVGGAFISVDGVPASNIARWDGSQWTAVGPGMSTDVYALATFDDGTGEALYAAGRFASIGGETFNRIARWDGAQWTPLGTGFDNWVYGLAVFDDGTGDALYAGGRLLEVDGVAAQRVAKWDGERWWPLDGGPDDTVQRMATLHDDQGMGLYLGGRFTQVGGTPSLRVARWGCPEEPCPADLDADGALTLFDFLAFQNLFDAGDHRADFDGDGELTLFDFLAFQNAFDAGC
jgi:hypothetical protein